MDKSPAHKLPRPPRLSDGVIQSFILLVATVLAAWLGAVLGAQGAIEANALETRGKAYVEYMTFMAGVANRLTELQTVISRVAIERDPTARADGAIAVARREKELQREWTLVTTQLLLFSSDDVWRRVSAREPHLERLFYSTFSPLHDAIGTNEFDAFLAAHQRFAKDMGEHVHDLQTVLRAEIRASRE